MTPLCDAHVHLTDPEFSSYLKEILASIRTMKMHVCSVTVDITSTINGIKTFGQSNNDIVTQFIGIHPQFVQEVDIEKFVEIFSEYSDSIGGIGEIGLDPTYTLTKGNSYQKQKQVFQEMLSLAEKSNKPISIHSRKSLDDILDIIGSYNLTNLLFHWFSGNKKQLRVLMDMGAYVSYGPPLVFSEDKRVLLKNTDRNRILIETDGPVQYPRCFAELPALPTSFLVTVAKSVGEVLDISYLEVNEFITSNTENFLGKKLG
ncbi:MAG: TatD family deoxyribonuclease [Nitrososphaeraceae archaeon]|nr:TatD family deoxyribonuclease [Nitrososphaeraceae archaeon]